MRKEGRGYCRSARMLLQKPTTEEFKIPTFINGTHFTDQQFE
jgi:hypothetical protein